MSIELRNSVRMLRFALALAVGSFAFSAAVQAVDPPSVSIASEPLATQVKLDPNLVLMFDDSLSMTYNYMPDGLSASDLGFRSSDVNKIYYNPSVAYVPPFQENGDTYSHSTFPYASVNGFVSDAATPNILAESDYSERPVYDSVNNQNQCDALNGEWDVTARQCSAKFNAFVYLTGTPGSFVKNYVVSSSESCADIANCHESDESLTIGSVSTTYGQNIANWYSYYRTRLLAAKSGVMNAFYPIGSEFRVGYGSINGDSLTDVAAFEGDHREAFWGWLEGLVPSFRAPYTPLRGALDRVGEYYTTDSAWEDENGVIAGCRQAYTVLTTDGYWNDGRYASFSCGEAFNSIGDSDGAAGSEIKNPNGLAYTYEPAAPYTDGYSCSGTLADVAMHYWKRDLMPDVENYVPTTDQDPAFWQHMVTFAVGLGVEPTNIEPAGTTVDEIFDWANGGDAIDGFRWPQPDQNSENNVADLAHAALNGRGGFYQADNPAAFEAGIAGALGRAAERVGTGASLAANSTRLESGTVAYQAEYYTGSWRGDLKAYDIASDGSIADVPSWSASSMLPGYGARDIRTYNPDSGSAVAFADPSDLSVAQRTDLGCSADATQCQDIVDYLRGGDANEEKSGGIFRDRATPLGDIVHSQPVYVGSPDPNLYNARTFDGADTYGTFAADPEGDNDNNDIDPQAGSETREGVVYVAANDGMLHGFDADTGEEIFAYLPGAVLTAGLEDLADPNYGAGAPSHKYFNDGELTVADIYDGGWKTVLVGTTGRGEARAVYALDITDPADIQFLWERSAGDGVDANDVYIGQMTGKPLIVLTPNGWRALIGNGYNSAQDKAALLEFDLESANGALSVHVTDDETGNGLAAPATFDTSSGAAGQDLAFAGDLNGRLWSFDLSDADSAGQEVFQAKDGGGVAQPITAGVLLGQDANDPDGTLWAFFGTGRYLSTDDADVSDSPQMQTWYGLKVGPAGWDDVIEPGEGASRSTLDLLIEREILDEQPAADTDDDGTVDQLAYRIFSQESTPGEIDDYSGWFIDLVPPGDGPKTDRAVGERMVVPNQFQGSVLVGTSLIPDQGGDECNPSGSGFVMGLDPFDGTNVDQAFVDFNGDGVVDSSDQVEFGGEYYATGAIGFSRLPNAPIFVGNSMLISFDDGSTASVQTGTGTAGGQRTSWREIVAD
ncbi:pilus assembly protein PilY [Guyparkeria sp. SCN-R1]|uniref:pilus assembly protein n=1 Tax=Guyparkeria sp. SCN-R1 TaxID=2341113 RepID=UPI000F648911|nr:PilC/PilY family type IV pilus protein [Guyparkeria sp. SCN-R1]RRQ23542.1 pilus assembly protein PilY [Guyparkeria sp. SCN-R1]